MILLLSFILGCNSKGMQEAMEKSNKEGRMILQKIDGYAQKAEMATQRAERTCFSFLRELFQKAGAARQEAVAGHKGRERK